MKKLSNGLVVVVGEDHSAPTFGLCISYGIGFRLEPEGRTGFAHLFEHMMFEGTPNAPKGVLDRVIEGGGGNNNGDTRYDHTEYIETAPISALDPVLWIEADRLKTLDFSVKNLENQRKVVEEEVRVNVMNRPYGLFFAIDLPGKAFDTYPNAHNFYGDFHDLDAAKPGFAFISGSGQRQTGGALRGWRRELAAWNSLRVQRSHFDDIFYCLSTQCHRGAATGRLRRQRS
jgi:hypothetical protein